MLWLNRYSLLREMLVVAANEYLSRRQSHVERRRASATTSSCTERQQRRLSGDRVPTTVLGRQNGGFYVSE